MDLCELGGGARSVQLAPRELEGEMILAWAPISLASKSSSTKGSFPGR